MIKNLMRFIGFWALFSLLFSALNMATSLEEKRWKEFYNLPRDSIDVIFIGNLHNYVAFQPQIIDDIVPVHSYVIGNGGESVVLTYYELKEVLRHQHPKMVVLETFTLDLNDEFMPTQNYFGFLDSGIWSANKTAVALRYIPLKEMYTLLPAFRSRMEWGQPHMYYSQLDKMIRYFISPPVDSGAGAAPLPEVMSEEEYLTAKTAYVMDFPPPSTENAEYLDKIRQLCLENGIQLVFTTAPMVSQPQITTGRYAPFDSQSYAADYQIPFVKYDPGLFTQLHYAESAHVNKFGSLILSMQMAQQIAVYLDLPVDQEKLAFISASPLLIILRPTKVTAIASNWCP